MFTRDAMIKGIAKATAKDKAKKNQQKNKSFAFNREENGALLSELDYKLIKTYKN